MAGRFQEGALLSLRGYVKKRRLRVQGVVSKKFGNVRFRGLGIYGLHSLIGLFFRIWGLMVPGLLESRRLSGL